LSMTMPSISFAASSKASITSRILNTSQATAGAADPSWRTGGALRPAAGSRPPRPPAQRRPVSWWAWLR
jgi:hypothetical protein